MLEEAEDKAARAVVEGRHVRSTAPYQDGNVRVCNQDGSYNPILSALAYVRANPSLAQLALRKRQTTATIHQPLAIVETPYSGDVEANTAYARACLLDSLRRGEAPIASHLLHTQVLDDMQPDERSLGIEAGLAWYRVATKCVVYTDRGISGGMKMGIDRASLQGVAIEYRRIGARVAG
jgi:hypothetical protein